jgi:hypothetical protein
MAGKEKQRLVIMISNKRPIHEVAHDLKKAGLRVDQVLENIGSVTGSAEMGAVERLRSIPGVADVSPDHPVNIGPPGTPVS